jgi:hypothetical protein
MSPLLSSLEKWDPRGKKGAASWSDIEVINITRVRGRNWKLLRGDLMTTSTKNYIVEYLTLIRSTKSTCLEPHSNIRE